MNPTEPTHLYLNRRVYGKGASRVKKFINNKFEPVDILNWKKYKYTSIDTSTDPPIGIRTGIINTPKIAKSIINIAYDLDTKAPIFLIYESFMISVEPEPNVSVYERLETFFENFITTVHGIAYKDHEGGYVSRLTVDSEINKSKYDNDIIYYHAKIFSILPENRRRKINFRVIDDYVVDLLNFNRHGRGGNSLKPIATQLKLVYNDLTA